MKFPDNPNDGDVFEYTSGVIFQYQKSTKSWRKIVGLSNVPLASSSIDGLMSSDDFNKLRSLLIPPPQTSLTSDECNTVYKEGIVKFESTKNDLNITSNLDVFSKSGKEKVDFIIHENTVGIDFSININRLIEELENRGKIKYRAIPGDDGDQGERGKSGRDNIETGPRGNKGKDGKNAPFAGTLVQDYSIVDQSKIKKVVVDIKNDPEDPRKLIVVFGNIGNVMACPNRVHWSNKNTNWLVALKEKIAPCNISCYKHVCSTEIFYIDTTTIQEQIRDRFNELLAIAKSEREMMVRKWLSAMIEMFNAQKQALCCAIEAIDSKEKNQTIRNSWSMARYAAAQAMYAFKLTSDDDNKHPRADPQQNPYDFLPGSGSEIGDSRFNGSDPDAFDCHDCFLIVDLLSYNIGQQRSVNVNLPAGDYVSTIVECCPQYDKSGYSGRYSIRFVDKDQDDNKVSRLYSSENKGYFNQALANAAYVGDVIGFKHYGGPVSFYLNPPPPNGSAVSIDGRVKLCVQPTKCFESCQKTNPTEITEISVEPTIGDLPSSAIRASHAEFYERGWRIGKACAAHTSILGTQFIVVFRSIGVDIDCGGGEYLNTPFIKYFNQVLGEQVAIAWPTIDGNGFFGLPRDDGNTKIRLVYDKDLSDMLVANINNNVVFKTIGDPKSSIKKVVVPILDPSDQTVETGTDPSAGTETYGDGLKWLFGSSKLIPRKIESNELYQCDMILNDGKFVNNYIQGTDDNNKFKLYGGVKKLNNGDYQNTGPLITEAKCISLWSRFDNYSNDNLFKIMIGKFKNGTLDTDSGSFELQISIGDIKLARSSVSCVIKVFGTNSQAETLATFVINKLNIKTWINITINRIAERYIDIYINGDKAGTIGPINTVSGAYQYGGNINGFKVSASYLDNLRMYNDELDYKQIKNLYYLGKNYD